MPDTVMGLINYLPEVKKDAGFTVLGGLIKTFISSNDIVYFFIIAAFQGLVLVYIYRKFSTDYLFSIFLFIASTDYFSWMFNGIRQFLAVTIIFGAFDLLVKRRYMAYALMAVVAAQFHASAYIMLPLAAVMWGRALNKKTIFLILGTAALIPVIDQFLPFLEALLEDTQYSSITSDEVWSVDDGSTLHA